MFQISTRALLPVVALVSTACTCSPDDRGSSPAAPRVTGWTPPVPPVPSAASSVATPPPAPVEQLHWQVPPSWRNLGVPFQGVAKAHFQALVEPVPGVPVPDAVDVFVVRHEGARGATPEERMKDVVAREAEAFSHVGSKKLETRVVDGRTLQVVEIHGTLREMVPKPPDWEKSPVERPGRTQITAFFPTKTFPYRVAIHGRDDLVERARAEFFGFVDSLRLENEASP